MRAVAIAFAAPPPPETQLDSPSRKSSRNTTKALNMYEYVEHSILTCGLQSRAHPTPCSSSTFAQMYQPLGDSYHQLSGMKITKRNQTFAGVCSESSDAACCVATLVEKAACKIRLKKSSKFVAPNPDVLDWSCPCARFSPSPGTATMRNGVLCEKYFGARSKSAIGK